jgi:hypothetical protein
MNEKTDRQWGYGVYIHQDEEAGDRFVVAQGEDELQLLVQQEIDAFKIDPERMELLEFGPSDGDATLLDCLLVLIDARELHQVTFKRAILEMARVPAFARFLNDPASGHSFKLSHLLTTWPARMEKMTNYKLRQRAAETLGLSVEMFETA